MKTMETKQKKTLSERFTDYAQRHQNAFEALRYYDERTYHNI